MAVAVTMELSAGRDWPRIKPHIDSIPRSVMELSRRSGLHPARLGGVLAVLLGAGVVGVEYREGVNKRRVKRVMAYYYVKGVRAGLGLEVMGRHDD